MTILIIIFCGLLCFGVIKYKSTFSPVGFLAFIWAFFILATLCFQSIIELKFIGIFFIIFAILCSLLGYYFANKTNKLTDKFNNIFINKKFLLYSLIATTLLGFINPIYHIYNHGLSLSNLFNFDEYLDMTTKLYLDRYKENTLNDSYFMQIFLIFTYTAPILGGYFWLNTQNKKQKLLSILTIVPCLFVTLTQSTKMTTISSIILWIAGFMTNIFTSNIKLKLSIKFYISFLSVFVLFIVFLYFSMITRASDKITSEEIENNEYKFVNYAIGSVPCFDNWFFYENTKKIDISSKKLYESGNTANKGYIESDSGIYINFDTLYTNWLELYGVSSSNYNYLPNQQYTMQITLKSDLKPQTVITSIWTHLSNSTHYYIDMTNVEQINDTTWKYWQTFTVSEERKQVRTPDFILDLNGSSYIEFSNFRIDTGTVALPWVDGDGNICFEPKIIKPKYYFGGMTFLGISNPLGLVKREIGIYQEYVNYSEKISSNGTNVYTAFRPLIEDFGKLGACIFMFLLGFLSSKAINFIQRRKYLALSQTILIAIYCYVMWSFVTSFWAYTSFLGAFGLTFIILHYVQKPKQNQKSVE